jgi:transcriptional regulator with XRE-family HTH domain
MPERFAAWRAARKLTLQQVADTVGATRQAISLWECGENDIGIIKLAIICRKAFKIDLLTFFGPLPKRDAA